MKKRIILYTIIFIILITISFIVIKTINENKNEEITEMELAEKVTDECTDEYEEMIKEGTQTANASNEKISPNAEMILKKIYTKCGHAVEEEVELPKEIVNKNMEELQREYKDWNVEEFSTEKVVLSKEIEGECGEHYILKDNDGVIAIYQTDENGEVSLIDETEIATEYLPQTDLVNIKDGLRVNGKENLNKILEDFE